MVKFYMNCKWSSSVSSYLWIKIWMSVWLIVHRDWLLSGRAKMDAVWACGYERSHGYLLWEEAFINGCGLLNSNLSGAYLLVVQQCVADYLCYIGVTDKSVIPLRNVNFSVSWFWPVNPFAMLLLVSCCHPVCQWPIDWPQWIWPLHTATQHIWRLKMDYAGNLIWPCFQSVWERVNPPAYDGLQKTVIQFGGPAQACFLLQYHSLNTYDICEQSVTADVSQCMSPNFILSNFMFGPLSNTSLSLLIFPLHVPKLPNTCCSLQH